MALAMTRRDISGVAGDCGTLALGLAAWLALYCAPPAIRDAICRSDAAAVAGPLDLGGLVLSWLGMMVAMAAPAALLSRRLNRASSFRSARTAAPSVAMLFAAAVTGALGEWLLQPLGLVDGDGRLEAPLFAPAMLATAALILIRTRLSMGRQALCHAACCIAMVLLQFAGGVTNLLWMAAIAGWMALESFVPWRREFAVLSGLTLCFAASFSLLQESG
jgi:predicted metal-binding membrane protein